MLVRRGEIPLGTSDGSLVDPPRSSPATFSPALEVPSRSRIHWESVTEGEERTPDLRSSARELLATIEPVAVMEVKPPSSLFRDLRDKGPWSGASTDIRGRVGGVTVGGSGMANLETSRRLEIDSGLVPAMEAGPFLTTVEGVQVAPFVERDLEDVLDEVDIIMVCKEVSAQMLGVNMCLAFVKKCLCIICVCVSPFMCCGLYNVSPRRI